MPSPVFHNRVFHSSAFDLLRNQFVPLDLSYAQKLVSPHRALAFNGDLFNPVQMGTSVSLYEGTLAVGASGEHYDENSANPQERAGAVYVFDQNPVTGVWSFAQKIVAPPGHRNGAGPGGGVFIEYNFGAKTIVHGNILTASMNTSRDENGANSNGSGNNGGVFMFKRTAPGQLWTFVQKLCPPASHRSNTDLFGLGDQDRAIQGHAVYDDTFVACSIGETLDQNAANALTGAGIAYVYTLSGGVWSEQQKICAPTRATNGAFPSSCAVYEDTIAFGQRGWNSNVGGVHVFTRSGGVWTLQQTINNPVGTTTGFFGRSVSLQGDTLAISAERDNLDENGLNPIANTGAVYIYTRSGGVWTLAQKLVPFDRATGGLYRMGRGVLLSGENYLVAGSGDNNRDENGLNQLNGAGAFYAFQKNGSSWTLYAKFCRQPTRLSVQFGTPSAFFSADGGTVVAGIANDQLDENEANSIQGAGAVEVFQHPF